MYEQHCCSHDKILTGGSGIGVSSLLTSQSHLSLSTYKQIDGVCRRNLGQTLASCKNFFCQTALMANAKEICDVFSSLLVVAIETFLDVYRASNGTSEDFFLRKKLPLIRLCPTQNYKINTRRIWQYNQGWPPLCQPSKPKDYLGLVGMSLKGARFQL